jgi:hypothetical protein
MGSTWFILGSLAIASGLFLLIAIMAEDLFEAIKTRKTKLSKDEIQKLVLVSCSAVALGVLYWLLQMLS